VAKMSIPAGRKRLTAVFRAAATEQPDATQSGCPCNAKAVMKADLRSAHTVSG
jgi:hypothetical protein